MSDTAKNIYDSEARQPGVRVGRAVSRSRVLEIIGVLAVLIALIASVLFFFLGVSRVQGNSMYPTYKDGEIVWYFRNFQEYSRGDVIMLRMPGGESYIKRITAVPGDMVDVDGGKLYVNGRAVNEPYADGETYRKEDGIMVYPYKLPKGKYFVMGDNRTVSEDSRNFGPVSSVQIKGKIAGQ